MKDSKYSYLFPYEKVPQGAKVIIYGAGNTGIEYLKQLFLTKYADVVAMIDRSYEKYRHFLVPVIPVEQVKDYQYDYIIIAQKNDLYLESIRAKLLENKVDLNRVIFCGIRNSEFEIKTRDATEVQYAYKKGEISIAVKTFPGMGDCIILKSLIVRLLEIMPEAKIDIYGTGITEFIKTFYADVEGINCCVEPNDELFEDVKNHYSLSLIWNYFLKVEHYDDVEIEKINPRAKTILDCLVSEVKSYGLKVDFPGSLYIHIMRSKYAERNVYNACYYLDVLGIKDGNIKIPMTENEEYKLRVRELGKYMTVNYGNGALNEGSSKQWPYENFCELVCRLRKKGYRVVQTSGADARKIDCCSEYFMGEKLEFVEYLLQGSMLHIDIEGGLVHLATHLGTKCIVLFGPTHEWFVGYRQNINIKPTFCGECTYLGLELFKCVRDDNKNGCINSITVDDVLNKAETYLRETGGKE